jgi:lipopolysaccharide assembly outer membrane protein LptD (OstA)
VADLLTLDNLGGPTDASGPGRVYLFQQGSVEPDGKKSASAQKQLYLTRVDFQGRLHSQKNKDNSRLAKFYDNIEVFHVPASTPNAALDPDKLPKGGMYLRSDRLTVWSRVGPDSKSNQEMHAEGNVFFQAQDVKGRATVVKYNQETEQVILEGPVGNRAVLERHLGPGFAPQRLEGTSIIYNRKTGEFSLAGVNSIQGGGQ